MLTVQLVLRLPTAEGMSDRASWLLYLVGSLLVFGSWIDIVPNGLGWIGWLMALGDGQLGPGAIGGTTRTHLVPLPNRSRSSMSCGKET